MMPFIQINQLHNYKPDTSMFSMHTHDLYEIFCFLNGDAKYYIEGNIYPLFPGDVFIMKKAEAHTLLVNSSLPYDRIVMNFNSEAVLKNYSTKILNHLNEKPLGKYNRYPATVFKNKSWLYYLKTIIKCSDLSEQRLYLTVFLKELMDCQCEIFYDEPIVESISNIIEYINLHLEDKITLEFLCKNFQISKTHLNRKFKEITGATIGKYILSKRLILANELMTNGTAPTNVYEQCGFKDYSTFYRAYKSVYKTSPKHQHDLNSTI